MIPELMHQQQCHFSENGVCSCDQKKRQQAFRHGIEFAFEAITEELNNLEATATTSRILGFIDGFLKEPARSKEQIGPNDYTAGGTA